jgi:transcriptional regulator with XRE-family HTH domain
MKMTPQQIKQARANAGLTQSEAAKMVGGGAVVTISVASESGTAYSMSRLYRIQS